MIADAVRSNLQWIGVNWIAKDGAEKLEKEVRMLDYACGPGNIANVPLRLGPSDAFSI